MSCSYSPLCHIRAQKKLQQKVQKRCFCSSPAACSAMLRLCGAFSASAKYRPSKNPPQRKIASQAAGGAGSIWSSAVSGVKRTLSSDAYIQGAKSGLPQDALLERVFEAKTEVDDQRDAYRDSTQKFLWTTKELNQATKNYALGWNAAPIPHEHKLGVILRNEPESAVSFLACLRAGIVYVGIPATSTADHVGRIIEQAQLRALLAAQPYIEREIVPLIPELDNPPVDEHTGGYLLSRKFPTLRYVMTLARLHPLVVGTIPMREMQLRNPVPDPLPRITKAIKPHAPAAAFYTADSLRAHTHSHAALMHAAASASRLLGIGAGDRVLSTLPLDTVHGHTLGPLMGVLSGAFVVNPSHRPDAAAAVQAASVDKVNVLVMTPEHAREFAASPALKKNPVSTVQRVLLVANDAAAARAARSAADELRASVQGVQVLLGLAPAQLAGLATLQDVSSSSTAGSLGSATPDVELKVSRSDGSTAKLGEPGRLLVKGPAVSRGVVGSAASNSEWASTELNASINSDASVVISA